MKIYALAFNFGLVVVTSLIMVLFGGPNAYAEGPVAVETTVDSSTDTFPANERFELRLPVGMALAKPSDLNALLDSAQMSALEVHYSQNVGIDALYDITHSISAGLRFDSVSEFHSDGEDGNAIEIAAHLFSVVGRKRWSLPHHAYVGGLASIGVYMPSFVNTHVAKSNWIQYKSHDTSAYSVAGEGGWFWNPFLIAFEVGYQSVNLKSLQTDTGVHLVDANNVQVDTNMSAPYAKLLLGIRL